MNEYWSKDDVIENAFLDLQHERDGLRTELNAFLIELPPVRRARRAEKR